MKNFSFTLLLCVFGICSVSSQIEFGIKGGIHSLDLSVESILLPGSDETFKVDFLESKYGFQFGLYSRLKLFGLYIEPAVMLHSTSINYTFEDIESTGIINTVRNETFTNLDIPLMLGFKLLFFKAFCGPVAHLNIKSASDLIDIPGYSQRFEKATYGFQAGLGFELWKIRIEAKYEGNLSKFGEHIYIGEKNFSFDQRPSRLIANIGYRF